KKADDHHYHLGKRECFRETVPVGVRNVSGNGGENPGRPNETNFAAKAGDPRLCEKKTGEEYFHHLVCEFNSEPLAKVEYPLRTINEHAARARGHFFFGLFHR